MAEETESGASLLARREYARAVPLLKRDLDKYQSNPRIRLQYADALAGAGQHEEAIAQYEHTAKYYEDNGLTVQAIAVGKKAEKLREQAGATAKPQAETAGKSDPLFTPTVPKSPLFEVLSEDERNALVREMELESHDEGSVIISEGQPGSSMYIIASGEVKVFTNGAGGSSLYLARLGEGDFFGEVSMLTGKPRTATITASQRTELLRLDKEKLDNALATYPGIRKVLNDFYQRRAEHTVEAMIESLKKK
jgi:cAMP-dependent protein kinase regulator